MGTAVNEPPEAEVVDIALIGAGLSGLGAAYYFRRAFPTKKIVLLEAREDIGGTWDLFRYPGVRSDSDLQTYAWEFKPWQRPEAIAEGRFIVDYMREVVEEQGLDSILRLGCKVTSAEWSSEEARWTLGVDCRGADGRSTRRILSTKWIFSGTGYFDFEEGYTPDFPGREDFAGDVLHPQHWPAGYDYTGKRVVVIGSGATAVTMIPAMLTGDCAARTVTMLQRTPTYIVSYPRIDKIAVRLMKVLGIQRGYRAARTKNVWRDYVTVAAFTRFPTWGRAMVRRWNTQELPEGYDLDRHFAPPYAPWDQRMCMTPDGDFFTAIRDGRAEVVTDQIVRFTGDGIELASGRHLDADVIVTATGMNLRLFGGIEQFVDGQRVDVGATVTYRGMLNSGLPNWGNSFGYIRSSSWTMKVGLAAMYVIEMIKYMESEGFDSVVPVPDPNMPTVPFLDITAGYFQRRSHLLPQQGAELPWRMMQSYPEDIRLLKTALVDQNLRFGTRTVRTEMAAGTPELDDVLSAELEKTR